MCIAFHLTTKNNRTFIFINWNKCIIFNYSFGLLRLFHTWPCSKRKKKDETERKKWSISSLMYVFMVFETSNSIQYETQTAQLEKCVLFTHIHGLFFFIPVVSCYQPYSWSYSTFVLILATHIFTPELGERVWNATKYQHSNHQCQATWFARCREHLQLGRRGKTVIRVPISITDWNA